MEKLKVSYLHTNHDPDVLRRYLNMADTYHASNVIWVCKRADVNKHGSMLYHLNQLEAEGYIKAEWADCKTHDNSEAVELVQISRTVKGHKLLDELKAKTPFGALKKRILDLLWVVLTTIITTLVVLQIKGV